MHTHSLPFLRRSERLVEQEQKDAAEAKADQLRKIERKCKYYAELLAEKFKIGAVWRWRGEKAQEHLNVCIKADRCERLAVAISRTVS